MAKAGPIRYRCCGMNRFVKWLWIAVLTLTVAVVIAYFYFSNSSSCIGSTTANSRTYPPMKSEVYFRAIPAEAKRPEKVLNVCKEDIDNPYKDTPGWQRFESELERYKEFHRRQLAVLKNASLHPGEGSPDVRTLTWACSTGHCSGLGDQLLRMQMWLLLAMISDRVFLIYWDEGIKRTTEYLLPNQINWSFLDENLGMCKDQNGYFSDCNRRTFSKVGWTWDTWEKDQYTKFGSILFGSETHITVTGRVDVNTMMLANKAFMDSGTLVHSGMERLGLVELLEEDKDNKIEYTSSKVWYTNPRVWFTRSWYAMSHHLFHYLFYFPKELISKVSEVERELGLLDKQYLSIHLRTGFKGSANQETRYILTMKYWKYFPDPESWKSLFDHSIKLADERIGRDSPIYLAADSQEAKDWAVNNYGNRIKMANLTVQHSSKGETWCGSKKGSKGGVISFWIDFLVLARSQVLVLGFSSFSVLAGTLCPIPLSRQSWISYDDSLNCLSSHIKENTTCIS